jgi:hypothetical protein
MLIPTNDRVLITSARTIRFEILIFMVLLLVTRALKFEIKRNHDRFYASLNLDAVTSNMIHLLLILRRLTVHY